MRADLRFYTDYIIYDKNIKHWWEFPDCSILARSNDLIRI